MWASVNMPAAPILTQIPANDLGKVVQDGPSFWVLGIYTGDLGAAWPFYPPE